MKRLTYLLLSAGIILTITACGEETTKIEETTNEVAQEWASFIETYNQGYDMIDGNKNWDGKEVTLVGVIEKVVQYQDSEGNDFAQACFGVSDDLFSKSQLIGLFSNDQIETLKKAKKDSKLITFSGKVKEKKFDEIWIVSCFLK